MGKPRYYLLAGIVTLFVVYIGLLINNQRSQELGLVSPLEGIPTVTPSTEPTITEMATKSALPDDTATETPTPTPTKETLLTVTPTPTAVPTPTVMSSQEVNGLVDRFAAQYGVDPNVIRYVALCESGFKSNATNGPYVGLFQFGAITWENIRKEMNEETDPDLRYNAEESVQTAAYVLSKNKGGIWPNCMP